MQKEIVMDLVQKRISKHGDAVISEIKAQGQTFYVLEDIKDIIPAGKYRLEPQTYGRWKTFPRLLPDPPGRSGILMHNGCLTTDTRGCLLVGTHVVFSEYNAELRNSKLAIRQLMEMLDDDGEPDTLTIVGEYARANPA